MKPLKKGISIFCVIALVFCFAAPCFAAGTDNSNPPLRLFASTTNYLTLASVNVRSGPGTNYSSVCTLSKGTTVVSDGATDNWIHITYGNIEGYIRSDLLCVKTRCYVTTAEHGLYMRQTAEYDGIIIGTIPYNTFVEVTGWNSDRSWAYVLVREGSLEDSGGWVYSTYLQKYNGIT